MKVARLSALHTDRLYPPGHTPGTHFSNSLSQPPGAYFGRKDFIKEKFQSHPREIEPATTQLTPTFRFNKHFAEFIFRIRPDSGM